MLDLAEVVRIAVEFSSAEQEPGPRRSQRDRRLGPLEAAGYGLTQTRRPRRSWSPAGKTPDRHPYAWACYRGAEWPGSAPTPR